MEHKSCNSHCKDKIVYKPKICTPQTWQLLLSTSNTLKEKEVQLERATWTSKDYPINFKKKKTYIVGEL